MFRCMGRSAQHTHTPEAPLYMYCTILLRSFVAVVAHLISECIFILEVYVPQREDEPERTSEKRFTFVLVPDVVNRTCEIMKYI